MRPNRVQARALLELLNHDNLIVSTKDGMGRRYSRWKNARGKIRAGKPGVGTFRSFRKKGWIEPNDQGVGTWQISELGTEIAQSIDLDAYKKVGKVKVTAHDVLKGLETYYGGMGYIVVPEVSIAYQGERRADALIVGRGDLTAIIAEIKVSRQDYKRELEDNEKRSRAIELSSQYFFVCPQGLIKPKELPEEAGLLEMDKKGKIHVSVPAPHRRPGMATWAIVGAVARALKRP